jgi:hypothetical protein
MARKGKILVWKIEIESNRFLNLATFTVQFFILFYEIQINFMPFLAICPILRHTNEN